MHVHQIVQVPRFGESAYYRSNRPVGIAAKDGHRQDGHKQRFYDADQQQPHIGVKDPARQNTVFRSEVARFPSDMPAFEARGLHPQMKKAQVRLSPPRPPPNHPTRLL